MTKFKKIYIEITNKCNLSCSFCIKTERAEQEMSLENFEIIIEKIKDYTKHVYLHVLGEPLLHQNIGGIMDICTKHNMFVNITTNGTLLNKKELEILKPSLRQINISAHSGVSIESLDNFVKKASKQAYINIRNWDCDEKKENEKIAENVFVSYDKQFVWPKIGEEVTFEKGYCYALKDHIAILVDGTVVPCCLDSSGSIGLSNIFSSDLEEILNSEKAVKIKDGFKNNIVAEEFCKTCGFATRLRRNL